MAARVDRWKADDGTIWETREEAESRDKHNALAAAIERLTTYGNVDPDELLQALTTGELGELVRDYHRTQ